MNMKHSTKFIIQENRLESLVKNYLDKYGLRKTSEMMGLSLSKIIEIAKSPIDSEVAFEILREKFIQGELKDTYKKFIISLDRMDGIFYWEITTRTDRYPEEDAIDLERRFLNAIRGSNPRKFRYGVEKIIESKKKLMKKKPTKVTCSPKV